MEEKKEIKGQFNIKKHVRIILGLFFLDAFITIMLGLKDNRQVIVELLLPLLVLGILIGIIIKMVIYTENRMIAYAIETVLFIIFVIILFFNVPIYFNVFQ